MDTSTAEKVDAVVAVPPVEDFYFTPARASALGAEAVKTVLKKCGLTAELLNFPRLKSKPARLSLPEELSYLREHLVPREKGPVSFFYEYRRFGPQYSECAEIIARRNPERLFISCFAWAYAGETIKLASAVKKTAPEIKIAAGGPGVTVNAGYFRKTGLFDAVLEGEAENSVPSYLGLSSSAIIGSDNPDFYIRETGVSAAKQIRYFSAILSRGCPKGCRFCANHLVHGRKFRKSSLKNIQETLLKIPGDMNIHINFEDDNLMLDKGFFFDVMKLVKKQFPEAGFSAENGLDYTLISREELSKLINIGFRSFNFSMASCSPELLEAENRSIDRARLEELLEEVSSHSLTSTTYFICGFKGETRETVLNNLVYLHRLPTLTGISMFYPVPGLPGFGTDLMSGFSPRLCAGSSAYPWNESLNTASMITAFRLARLSNMLKTSEGLIPGTDRTQTDNGLSGLIKSSGKLFTRSGGNIVEVPAQDEQLVTDFLSAVS